MLKSTAKVGIFFGLCKFFCFEFNFLFLKICENSENKFPQALGRREWNVL